VEVDRLKGYFMNRVAKAVESRRSFRPVRRSQLVDEVIEQLRLRVSSGDLKVGDKLPAESVLVSELGVGRTTLREAVRVLEHAGLFEVRQGSGTYLRSITDAETFAPRLRHARVLEVLDIRRALEIEMTRMAAAYRTDAALVAMRDALDRMRRGMESSDERGFIDAEMEVYRIIAAGTQNSIMIEIYALFAEALRLALTQIVAIPGVMSDCVSRHEQLFKAIAARDVDRAEAVAKAHLGRVTKLVQEVLGDARVSDAGGS
jgi:GntR family transcriptional regulator, transcriptional repressor for pyruvate dehydrogenase complex